DAKLEGGVGRGSDGLGLAALLGADARIGAGGINQRENRNGETIGQLHQSRRLAIALRARHAEIVPDAALGGGTLLVADNAEALAVETTEAADDRLVVAELAVAGDRREIADQSVDVVQAVRPLRVARHLRLLPRREVGKQRLQRLGGAGLEALDLLADRHRVAARLHGAQLLDLGLELGNRLFEVEIAAHRASERRHAGIPPNSSSLGSAPGRWPQVDPRPRAAGRR